MPRETIRKLSENTERLLVAGAHLARGNAELTRDKEALDQLIAKLGAKSPPVFAKLAEQLAKTLTAPGKTQALELLSLATSLAQVRAGLAQLAPVPSDDTAVPVAHAVETPCNAKDLYAVHDALVTTGQGRMEVIDSAVERGDIGDLRLVHAVVQAMSDAYIGATVADKVVPQFGRAIVEPIRKKLRFPGSKVDGRRLRALVAVQKDEARDLIDEAIATGSADMRAAAFDAIADHLPGAAGLDALALAALDGDKSGEVRRAAVRALAGYGTDASLQTLLEALDDARTLHQAAEALAKSRHPDATTRLLERLESSRVEAAAKVKKDDKAAATKRDAARSRVSAVLRALSEHRDPRIAPAVRALLEVAPILAAQTLVAQGHSDDLRLVADLLHKDYEPEFRVAVDALGKLPVDEAFDRVMALFVAKDRDTKLGKARLTALRSARFVPVGPRWAPALLALLGGAVTRPEALAWMIAATGDAQAVAPLMAALEREKKAELAAELVDALGTLGDKRALPPIIARVAAGELRWSISHAVLALADETTVDAVRTLFAALKNPNQNWELSYLLRSLERRYPGH